MSIVLRNVAGGSLKFSSTSGGSTSFSSSAGGSAASLYTMTFPFTFTNMGATGESGPTSISYGTDTPGYGTAYVMTLSGGIQYWTVPTSRSYTFTVAGSSSTNPSSQGATKSSSGAVINATYSLTAGHVIKILVGQMGLTATSAQSAQPGCGGGGGTYVYNSTTSTLLFVAGGGAGIGWQSAQTAGIMNATLTITGQKGQGGQGGAGGTGPNGGLQSDRAGGGGGYSGNGGFNAGESAAFAFTNGGVGGIYTSGQENPPPAGTMNGGFGGGGAGQGGAGGGGGGYGGGGGGARSSSGGNGGGAGSYDITGAYSGGVTNTGAMGYVTVT